MFRKMLVLLLTAIILFPYPVLADHAQKIEKQIRKLAGEQVVLVRLQSGHQTKGRIGSRSELGFTLRTDAGDEQLSYQDVRAIQKVKPPRSNKGWKIVGAVALGGLIALGALVWANREIPVEW